MVWFHGGDFNTGTPAIWDASILVNKQKVSHLTSITEKAASKTVNLSDRSADLSTHFPEVILHSESMRRTLKVRQKIEGN